MYKDNKGDKIKKKVNDTKKSDILSILLGTIKSNTRKIKNALNNLKGL